MISLAIALDTMVCIDAAAFLSFRKNVVVGILLLGCFSVGSRAEAQAIPRGKIDALPAFIDATVPTLMERGHVPGAAIAIVHEGRIVMLRGYGQARLDSSCPWYKSPSLTS